MSATEIVNNPLVQVAFNPANPPTLVCRNANVRGVTRTGAGVFEVELVQKISAGGGILDTEYVIATNLSASAAAFVQVTSTPTGDLLVHTRNLAGALADLVGRVDVSVFGLPNVG